MKIFWIGQAGLFFETDEGVKIMVDPYFSNSCQRLHDTSYRRMPVDERFLNEKPDIMVFTHNHLDHYDPETVDNFITENSGITVLAPSSVWAEARKRGGNNNYVQFDRHTEWTQSDVTFKAVKATHSDAYAIGVIIEYKGKTYYITGDTLYNTEIFGDLPQNIDYLFLPVNGVGNNMNFTDAIRFAKKVGAKTSVPLHYGMFDELDPENFKVEGRFIPKVYEQF